MLNNNSPISAAIYGCAGLTLSPEEITFFKRTNPTGFILFKRNIHTPDQVKALVAAMKATTTHTPLILIDQEGGRVARLGAPHWRTYPAAGEIAAITKHNRVQALRAMYLHYRLIASDLTNLGINVNCAPMLDIPAENSDDIIGDRALGDDVDTIITLGKVVCEALLDGGILPVIKHIPGHGRATADSHKTLPIVDVNHDVLESTDFRPFQALNYAPLGMTAHIIYPALDTVCCATLSSSIIQLIRNTIGFDGLLMTDDLSMHALTGSFSERTTASLTAGCDVVLHCNGMMAEMLEIASVCPALTTNGLRRLHHAIAMLATPKPFDTASAEREFSSIFKS